MKCDRIAPFYVILETAAFGRRLQKHRLAFLNVATGKRRALVLGDGDGRFLQTLAQAYPHLEIDSVEISRNMLVQTSKRLQQSVGRRAGIRLIRADARSFSAAAAQYDIVFTHFFLDCFPPEELELLIERISGMLSTTATWIISDFRQATHGWRMLYTRLWLYVMYQFFGLVTGLQVRHLPAHDHLLQSAGFTRHAEQVTSDGLIAAEYWQR